MNTPFHQRLTEYCEKDLVPWHMPGHKRQLSNAITSETGTEIALEAAKRYDVTELPSLDDLYEPAGSLADSIHKLSEIYGSARSYYQVNGSTGGILAAISAAAGRGESILMARNCHRSVYHAVALLELVPHYLEPEEVEDLGIYGGIKAEQVADALREYPEVKAVVLTSPTYEGIVSDLASIVQTAHEFGIYVIVDEAHGAHYTFDSQDIESAVALGADLVIESLHKTLPCYTQCAILHIGKYAIKQDTLIRRVERYIRIYQTTSPSYIFVADMERVIMTMDTWRDTEFPMYLERLRRYRKKWEQLRHIHILSIKDVADYGGYRYDETRLVLIPDGISGEQFRILLEEEYGQVMEMASVRYALAISTVMDSEEAFRRLDDALWKIDAQLQKNLDSSKKDDADREAEHQETVMIPVLKQEVDSGLIPGIAWNLETEYVEISGSEGRMAGDYVTVYPPGIPTCVPGEKITRAVIEHILRCHGEGLMIQGIQRIPAAQLTGNVKK